MRWGWCPTCPRLSRGSSTFRSCGAPQYSAGSLPPEAADFPEEDRDTADYETVDVPPEVIAETGGSVGPTPTALPEDEVPVELEPEPVEVDIQAEAAATEVAGADERPQYV